MKFGHYRAAALSSDRHRIPDSVPLSDDTCAKCQRAIVSYTPTINAAKGSNPDLVILCPECFDEYVENYDGLMLMHQPAIEEAHLPAVD